jgi:hypothetical protein
MPPTPTPPLDSLLAAYLREAPPSGAAGSSVPQHEAELQKARRAPPLRPESSSGSIAAAGVPPRPRLLRPRAHRPSPSSPPPHLSSRRRRAAASAVGGGGGGGGSATSALEAWQLAVEQQQRRWPEEVEEQVDDKIAADPLCTSRRTEAGRACSQLGRQRRKLCEEEAQALAAVETLAEATALAARAWERAEDESSGRAAVEGGRRPVRPADNENSFVADVRRFDQRVDALQAKIRALSVGLQTLGAL